MIIRLVAALWRAQDSSASLELTALIGGMGMSEMESLLQLVIDVVGKLPENELRALAMILADGDTHCVARTRRARRLAPEALTLLRRKVEYDAERAARKGRIGDNVAPFPTH